MRWIMLLLWGAYGSFCLVLLVSSGVWGYRSYVLSQVGVTTLGQVVKITESRETDDDGRGIISYTPLVEFRSAGEKHYVDGERDYRRGKYEVGTTVSVLYDPGNPANAEPVGSKRSLNQALGLGVFGLLCAAIGIGAMWMAIPRK